MTFWARTLGGLVWAYASMAGEQALSLITTVLLARILYPGDFGVLALALVVLGYIDTLRDLGIKDALIYAAGRKDEMADTAATLGLAIGIVQCVVAILAAPLASYLIDDDRVVPLIRILSLTFIVNSLAVAQDGLLQRRLSFRGRCVSDLSGAGVKAVVTISLAVAGMGLWGIAVGHLAGAVTRTVARSVVVGWLPTFRLNPECARGLWRFGKHILFVNVMGALLARADQIAIASLMGATTLGYYFIAARIPELIVGSLSMVLTLVLFPAFTGLNGDRTKLKSAFCGATKFTALAVVPASAGLVAVAPELVHTLFGARWTPSAPILQVLAIVAMAMSLGWNAGDLFKAIGRPELQSLLVSIQALITIPLVLLFAWSTQRPEMVAFGYLVGAIASTVLRLWIAYRLLSLRLIQLAQLYCGALIGGGAILIAVSIARPLVAGSPSWMAFSFLVLVGVSVYLPFVWWIEHKSIRAAIHALRETRWATRAGQVHADGSVAKK